MNADTPSSFDSALPDSADRADAPPRECVDCGAELKPYETKVCLECEDRRYRENGIDDFLT